MTQRNDDTPGTSTDPLGSPKPAAPCAYLVALSGEAIGRLYKLTESRNVIGHANGATIKLHDDGVTAHHAELRQDNGSVVLTALDHESETYVNGKPVQRHALTNGDRIQLGTIATLKYTTSEPLTQTGYSVSRSHRDTPPDLSLPSAVGASGITYRDPTNRR